MGFLNFFISDLQSCFFNWFWFNFLVFYCFIKTKLLLAKCSIYYSILFFSKTNCQYSLMAHLLYNKQ